MTIHAYRLLSVTALSLVFLSGNLAVGQTRWNSGQNVQPVFEGWERNPDGTFNMVYGYLNRNYQEEPHVPIGSSNFFEPGSTDRGQPTHFYARRQSFVFKVQVPADWGDKDLVWIVTHQGRTDKAYGSLWPVWEIDESVIKANRGMGISGAYVDNGPPIIQIASGETERTVTLPDTVTLTVLTSDDGIPGPDPEAAKRRGGRRGRPGPNRQNVVNPRDAVAKGLAVTWLHHRGPGTVKFDPAVPPITNGTAVTTARFSEPGIYVLRAVADDTVLTTTADVTVTVNAESP
jgi:hypothetical protein